MRHRLQNFPRDIVGGDAFALRGEIRDDAVAHDRQRDGGDVIAADIDLALQNGVGFRGHDEVQRGARTRAPAQPFFAKIEALPGTRSESAELRQAGDLAKQGKTEEAMRLYKQLYGDRPPDGDIALAYYQTLYGTDKGKPEAIAGMRALSARRFASNLSN